MNSNSSNRIKGTVDTVLGTVVHMITCKHNNSSKVTITLAVIKQPLSLLVPVSNIDKYTCNIEIREIHVQNIEHVQGIFGVSFLSRVYEVRRLVLLVNSNRPVIKPCHVPKC